MVYIQTCGCECDKPPAAVVHAERNGHAVAGAITQQLPEIKVESLRRHRAGDAEEEEGPDPGSLNMKDLTLGALIGAAGAIFMVGLLLIFLIR